MLEGIEGSSTYAADIDRSFWIVTGLTGFLFIVTIGAMLYFAWRYRSSRVSKEETVNIHHHTPLEIAWTVIPTILLMVMFYYGLSALRQLRTFPDEATTVKVLGQRWSWHFEYENGKKTTELYVPVNENIILEMTAPKTDVLHSFYVPAFRTKEDVIPGKISRLWFNATHEGKFDILCAEYCGTRHSYMKSRVIAIPKADFTAWMESEKRTPYEPEPTAGMASATLQGKTLMENYGCTGCHSMEGDKLVGPPLNDILGKEVQVNTDGTIRTLKRDIAYLKNSILKPNADIVEGFQPMMPPFEGTIPPEELDAIIAFITGEKTPETEPAQETTTSEPIAEQKVTVPAKPPLVTSPPDGRKIAQQKGCIACHSEDGSKRIGPSFQGIWQREVTVTENGKTKTIISDETYLRNSVLRSNDQIVEGFQPMMPPFEGLLKEEELDALIHYFKELK